MLARGEGGVRGYRGCIIRYTWSIIWKVPSSILMFISSIEGGLLVLRAGGVTRGHRVLQGR